MPARGRQALTGTLCSLGRSRQPWLDEQARRMQYPSPRSLSTSLLTRLSTETAVPWSRQRRKDHGAFDMLDLTLPGLNS